MKNLIIYKTKDWEVWASLELPTDVELDIYTTRTLSAGYVEEILNNWSTTYAETIIHILEHKQEQWAKTI